MILSSIQIAETEDGVLYAVKSGITISVAEHALMHFKIGPLLFYLSEESIKQSELDHRLAKLVLFDSESAKRLIRIRVERAIQMELSSHFTKAIILVDGSLKSSLFENKTQGIINVAENCLLYKNSVVGISKNTNIKILDRVSSPLTKIRSPAYMNVEMIVKSLIRNTIGTNLLIKFGNNNSHVLRADIVTNNGNINETLGKLLGNDSIAGGYPETLRLAHHISTFTSTEISCLRSHVLNNYDVIELASEDIRRTLLAIDTNMKILSKNGNELIMIAMQTDTASKGDYLLIEDENSKRKMIVQIYDEEYLSSQSLIEDIVKDEVVNASSMENLHDPLNIGSLSRMIRDARLFHTKIRAAIDFIKQIIKRCHMASIKGIF